LQFIAVQKLYRLVPDRWLFDGIYERNAFKAEAIRPLLVGYVLHVVAIERRALSGGLFGFAGRGCPAP
jgi:hypothetical protein